MKFVLFLILNLSNIFKTQTSGVLQEIVTNQINKFFDATLKNTQCWDDFRKVIEAATKNEIWALKIFDASGKFQSGILEGNRFSYGNYDECLNVKEIKSQYCILALKPNQSTVKFIENFIKIEKGFVRKLNAKNFEYILNLRHGVCVPTSCTISNLQSMLQYFNYTKWFKPLLCYQKERDSQGNTQDFYVFLIFFIIVMGELFCTLYDLYLQNTGQTSGVLSCFSLYLHCKKIFSFQTKKHDLSCLYGIRTISMMWIIYGHSLLFKVSLASNTLLLYQSKIEAKSVFDYTAPYAVDTFFCISGFLVVHTNLKHGKLMNNLDLFYLHRILRLTPTILATVLINISLTKYLFEGPKIAFFQKTLQHNCEKNWWSSLFFLTSLMNFQDQCITSTWYLSVETPLYVISPLIIYYLGKNPKTTFRFITLICMISFTYTWFLVLKYKLGFILFFELNEEEISFVYFSTICRMPAWFVGTYFGYMLYHNNLKKIQIPKLLNIALLILSFATQYTLMLYHIEILGSKFSVYRSGFMNTFSRPLWALSCSYIILSCSNGQGGFVNTFLSNPLFMILEKFTYSLCLIHLSVIQVILANSRSDVYYSALQNIFDFWGFYILSLGAAFILTVTIERPVMSWFSYFAQKKSKRL